MPYLIFAATNLSVITAFFTWRKRAYARRVADAAWASDTVAWLQEMKDAA